MNGNRAVPWPGIGLAFVTAGGMLAAGADFWLTLGVVVIWLGTLWLTRPEPATEAPRSSLALGSDNAMRALIEPLSFPLLLFDRGRITAANAAARTTLGAHIVGQDARIALRHPQAVALLDHEDGASVTVRGLTHARSQWQLTRTRIDERYTLIELIDRTGEADVSRAHTDFVANASHELRTPLAAVIGYVETLSDSDQSVDPATSARFHEIVLREARRMQGLVADLMSLSQLEAEKHDPPTDPLDLTALARRIVGEVAALRGKDRVVLRATDSSAIVTGDSRQIEQLLRNLIDNALKYGDPEAAVEVSIGPARRGEVELAVQDHGPGIAPEHLPHLTRRFYRTDPGRSRAAGGTGLGLAIVKHIVERHRGRLDIASRPSEGTRVSIHFPAATSALPQPVASGTGVLS